MNSGPFEIHSSSPDVSPSARAGQCWHIRVSSRPGLDAHGRDVLGDIHQLGLGHITEIRASRLYYLAGAVEEADVRLVAEELLADPVAETCEYRIGFAARPESEPSIEIHPLPGVMNPVAMSTLEAVRRLLRARGRPEANVRQVQTARCYVIVGAKNEEELEQIAGRALANDCIERWYIHGLGRHDAVDDVFPPPPQRAFDVRYISLRKAEDEQLRHLSRQGHLFLSLREMQAIRDYYGRLGRDPTDLELETLAQTWSEHCVHKTLKSAFDYSGDDFGRPGYVRVHFRNLFKETIVAATEHLGREWCLSVFKDNAGVIAFDDAYGLAFKVETHNHPSAIEPYGGAATGVGGCIRDIMGCGLGAKPIASTDVFCLAPPDFDAQRLPQGVLHPRRVLKGVVGGVRDYGNRMGIPTVNGAIHFDERYLANPLVFCGCIGLIPRNRIAKGPRPGDRIVVAGGRTGRDGIHGATFSSAELTDTHAEEFSHAVQIGHAIEEKKLLDALLRARDHTDGCLYSSVTDCGAGGLSSAVGEMGAQLGAVVELKDVPLKYAGLRYDEIWISEAQERMVFAVPPDRLDEFLRVFFEEEVEATVIGTFNDDRVLRIRYDGQAVGELDMGLLHGGSPSQTLKATWISSEPQALAGANSPDSGIVPDSKRFRGSPSQSWVSSTARVGEVDPSSPLVSTDDDSSAGVSSLNDRLLTTLRDWSTASKEWVIRQYDHEVQGRSVIKPLVGPRFGPSDAAVLRPRYESYRGVAVGCGLCPQVADFDPYLMAVAAIDEALRNVVCVGADPARTAILDNFCWPKVDTEESLGALVRTCVGARDAAIAYGLPFISGKDSLNNEFTQSVEDAGRTGLPQRLAIPYTLLVSALGIIGDVRRCVSMDLKEPGNCLVLASAPVLRESDEATEPRSDGERESRAQRERVKGSDHAVTLDDSTLRERQETFHGPAFDAARAMHDRVAELIAGGKVRACHDISDGGLAVAVAEMCIASGFGASVSVDSGSFPASLFEPLTTSYVLEMAEADAQASSLPVIGRVEREPVFRIAWDGRKVIDVAVGALGEAWRRPLSRGGGG